MKKGIILATTLAMALGVGVAVGAHQEKVFKLEAASDGWNLVGIGGWDAAHAVAMQSGTGGNIAQKTEYSISANTEFKLAYITSDSIDWGGSKGAGNFDEKSYQFAEGSDNIKIKYTGTYSIYLNSSYNVYLSRSLTITFNPESGTVSPTSKIVTQSYNGDTINKYGDLPTPTRDGYAFDGWYTASSGGDKIESTSSTYSLTANQMLYAHWTAAPMVKKYAVIDGVKESSPISSEAVTKGTSYAVPDKLFREGYTFGGWYSNEECTVNYTATTINSDTIIYAKYTTRAAVEGTINVDLRDSGWSDAAANYAVFFMDKTTYAPAVAGSWSTYVTGVSIDEKYVSVPYSVGLDPEEMIVVRYDSTYTQSSWNAEKWPGSELWGQTLDVDYADMIRIGAETGEYTKKYNSYEGYPKIKGGSPWAEIAELNSVKSNGSHHTEYFSESVSLSDNQEFKVHFAPYADGDYYGEYSTHSSISTYFTTGSDGNVKCLKGGTYAIYFDSTSNSIYITDPVTAAADEWAQYFLSHVGCNPQGTSEPTGWSDCATEYGKLSNATKDLIYGTTAKESGTYVEQAVARYDYAVAHHSGLTRFIVNSGSTPRASAYINPSMTEFQDSNTMIIVIAIAAVSALAFTTLLVFKKKKQK